jgi:hypothetical protein
MVVALAQSLRVAMEFVELIEGNKQLEETRRDADQKDAEGSRSIDRPAPSVWQKYR